MKIGSLDWKTKDLYCLLVTFAYIWKDIEERDEFQKVDLQTEVERHREI